MKKIIIISILSISLFFSSYTNALETNSSLIKAYNSFIIKLEARFKLEEQLIILEKVKTKLDITIKTRNLSTKSIILLKELNTLNNKKILIKKKQISDIKVTSTWQVNLEYQEIQKFKNISYPTFPDYISKLFSTNISYLKIIYNDKNSIYEFYDNSKIKRLVFSKYYEITDKNYNLFKGKSGYILYNNWKFIFVDEFEIEEKIPYSKSSSYFKWVIDSTSTNYHLKDWVYNYYKFDKYIYIQDNYWFYQDILIALWLNPKDLILFKNWNNYSFINNYTENKLITSNYLDKIVNKAIFFDFLLDDKKTLNYDTDKYFQELKRVTEALTNWLSKDEKIKKIYNYILENVTYTNPLDLNKKEIFSWIDTFKNKDWVCEWYAKLMWYMLLFAWIEDIELIRWFVLNAPDFPKVWHAWLKIWDYYYDPTFDDPIWNTKTKRFDEYVYYKLPRDLFYTNRYDLWKLPEELKTKSTEELTTIINKNLYNLISKYKDSWQNIMKYTLMLYKNWLDYNDKITILNLKKMLINYEINWTDLTFTKDWKKTYIKKLKYYKLEDDTIQDLLKNINYELNNKYILKWNFWDWTYEYRLAYELEVY